MTKVNKDIKTTNKYSCPVCKKAPKNGKFRRTWQWKTLKGFNEHKCWKTLEIERIEFLKKQEEIVKKLEEQRRLDLEKFRLVARYKVGESVYYTTYDVTGPTHELRGERLVKVRYEEERVYSVYNGVIMSVVLNGYIVNNTFVPEGSIYLDKDEALNKVQESQKVYDNYLRDCSSYR